MSVHQRCKESTNLKIFNTIEMKVIDQAEFIQKSKANPIIIDVRTPMEVAGGKIPNATVMNITDTPRFIAEIKKLEKDKSYLVYCRSGQRSAMACKLMDSLGFKDTNNLQGGIMNWNGAIEK